MPAKKHHVKLSTDERAALSAIARKKNAAAVKAQKAKALLSVDCGRYGPAETDKIASAKSTLSTRSIEKLRVRVCQAGPLGALERKPRETPPRERKVTGEVEAHIVQIACSEAPEGRSRWTLQMIAERLVELKIVDTIGKETVRTALKKTISNLGGRNTGVSRPKRMPDS